MFDPKSIMEKRELQEPIPTSDPADFPRSEEVPEEEKNYQRKKRPRLFSSYMEEEICWCLLTRAVSFIIICGNWGKR